MGTDTTRESILSAAKYLFVRFGYEKTSMNDIAKAARKAKGSIYYNFTSKLDIYSKLLEAELEAIIKELTDKRIYFTTTPYGLAERMKHYLSHRMEVLNLSHLCRQAVTELYYSKDAELCRKIEEMREALDLRERHFFSELCSRGRKSNFIPRQVSPDSFADMMIMILKSLEIQFFVQNRYDELKKTYDCMLEVMVGNTLSSRQPYSPYNIN